LQRRRTNLVLGHGWCEIEEDLDISAHGIALMYRWVNDG
jgi:hypothetical protein